MSFKMHPAEVSAVPDSSLFFRLDGQGFFPRCKAGQVLQRRWKRVFLPPHYMHPRVNHRQVWASSVVTQTRCAAAACRAALLAATAERRESSGTCSQFVAVQRHHTSATRMLATGYRCPRGGEVQAGGGGLPSCLSQGVPPSTHGVLLVSTMQVLPRRSASTPLPLPLVRHLPGGWTCCRHIYRHPCSLYTHVNVSS